MTAGITWLYSDSDSDTPAQTKTVTGLSFFTGDKILVVGFAFSAGHGSTHAMSVDDTATTNNPNWGTPVSSAYNTTSSASFPTRMSVFISDELIADETFNITMDWQSGSANDYYGVLGIARVTGCTGGFVHSGTDIGAYRDDDATCTFAGAATSGNLVVMMVAHGGPAPYTYDTPPANFTQVSGSTSTTTGDAGLSAISSITTTASSFAWGYEAATNDAEFMCAVAVEIAASGGGGSPKNILIPSGRRSYKGLIVR